MNNPQEFAKLIQKAQKKLERYNKILQTNITSAFAYKQRMEVYILLGKVKEGFEDLKKALSLSPNDQDLINHPLNPNNPNPAAPTNLEYAILFFNIANYFYRNKDYPSALRYINLALDRETTMVNFYLLKGFILHDDENSDNQEAMKIASQIIAEKPENPLARYLRGVIIADKYPLSVTIKLNNEVAFQQYENLDALEAALADIDYALAKMEDNIELRVNGVYKKIQILILLNQIDLALETLNHSIQNYDSNLYTYYLRAIINLKKGDITASNNDFSKFVELLPQSEAKTILEAILNNDTDQSSSFLGQAQQYLGEPESNNGSRGSGSILDNFNFNPN